MPVAIVKLAPFFGLTTMRKPIALLIAFTATIATVPTPSVVQAAGCPADPRRASLALWPGGSINTGKTVTGTHPCGRKLTCVGGIPGNFSSRQCHWGE